ncbi:zinc finger MYND domain-containing protein [Phanerochaete sordida]|uniref:Zinc finger MYND domain-containing protein n=1 Tax=Phanerochaete sordida TaxID=48140 RepID=A0A9P3GGJ6_9APHY|nr:zinc finger MYND domain-containing protein [Phanerochaete sordida]
MLLLTVLEEIGMPAAEYVYSSGDLEPLFAIPRSWALLLNDMNALGNADKEGGFMKICMMAALDHAIRLADDDVWRMVRESSFLFTLAEQITANYLFGYTQDQLTDIVGQDENDIRGINLISLSLSLLCSYIDRIFSCTAYQDDDLDVVEALDILQYAIPSVFLKLWDVRDTFLISSNACSTDKELIVLCSLHEVVHAVGYASFRFVREHRQFAFDATNSRLLQVFFVVWIFSTSRTVRYRAFKHIMETLDEQQYGAFFQSVSNGCTGHEHVTAAVLRDFRDECVVDDRLNLLAFFTVFRGGAYRSSDPQAMTASVLQLAAPSIAAARRQFCLGTSPKNPPVDTQFAMLFSVSSALKRDDSRLFMSDRQVYGLIGLLCVYTMHQITGNDPEGPAALGRVIRWWFPRLQELSVVDRRPKTLAIRTHTLTVWQTVMGELSRRRMAQRSSDWRDFVSTWIRVGGLMPPVPDEVPEDSPFEPLQRCGWSECLCSVHAPAHSMRVCKGCWLVAYCGANCQKNDWEQGGHQQRCRRRTAV